PARYSSKFFGLVGTCLLAGTGIVHAVELDRDISIEIAANTPLDQALAHWGALAGIQVMLSAEMAADRNAEAIHGRLPARAALSQLLRNSGLGYRVVAESVVIIPI